MKIMLINPIWANSNTHPPLGLAYLGAIVEQKNCEIKMIDANATHANYTLEGIVNEVESFSPDVVGITILTDFARNAYRLADALSHLDSTIVAGGPHPSAIPHEAFNYHVDIVVRGEGEQTLSELIDVFENKKELKDVAGISYKNGEGNIIDNPTRPLIKDLDTLPFPAKHLFDKRLYTGRTDREMCKAILTGRGCPMKCTFCAKSVTGDRYRFRSPKNILIEMKHVLEKYGTKSFAFVDDTFSANKKRVEELCNLIINENLGINWSCVTRIDLVTEELLMKMKQAGCYYIDYGIEHGDNESLEKMNKKITIEQAREVLQWTKNNGIYYVVNFVFGFPWDTVESTRKTYDVAEEFFQHGIQATLLAPYPGTELYRRYKDAYGLEGWWLKRDGINRSLTSELALGRKLDFMIFKLDSEVEKEIELSLRRIHSFSWERSGILSGWFFRFRKILYKINPTFEELVTNLVFPVLRLFGRIVTVAKKR